jgi:putative tryptophan/tyrosine transport system substrate-binding protein
MSRRAEPGEVDRMRRRDFITVLAGATAWMSVARAGESPRRVGILGSATKPNAPFVADFVRGLNDTGFIEGRNVSLEDRWADGHYDRLPSLAAELVGRDVALLACLEAPSAAAAKAITKTVPIVFMTGADPVKMGLVDSFSRPGGNLTGVSVLVSVLGPKRLELLVELVPTARIVFLIVNPGNPNVRADVPETQRAAEALGRHLEVLTASSENELDTAFATIKADALLVMPDPYFFVRCHQLVALAARRAMPAIYPFRECVDIGGLISYGTPFAYLYHQMGMQAGKILKGARPADLPIQQSTRYELVINSKTAKSLGLTVPSSLLARADEVME